MLQNSFNRTHQGARDEQLDRYICIRTEQCLLSVMADGFSQCDAKPHFVDWLILKFEALAGFHGDCDSLCTEIENILCRDDSSPGKASIAIVVCTKDEYRLAALGDTRIYCLPYGERTTDHSLAQWCVERGHSPLDALRDHPLRNKLTKFACAGSKHTPGWSRRKRSSEDRILICTDGFWRNFDDREIFAMTDEKVLTQAFDRLLDMPDLPDDNVTVAFLCNR